MQPQIYPLVEAFAQAQGLPLRLDREEAKRRDITLQTPCSTDAFDAGFYGEMISEALFLQRLTRADEQCAESLEMMCHPAFLDATILQSKYCHPRLVELDVLTAPTLKAAIAGAVLCWAPSRICSAAVYSMACAFSGRYPLADRPLRQGLCLLFLGCGSSTSAPLPAAAWCRE